MYFDPINPLESIAASRLSENAQRPAIRVSLGAVAVWVGFGLSVWGVVGFIVYHFVSKYW